jgi:hypothetical protein
MPGLKWGTDFSGTSTDSPVFGLRPLRGGRVCTVKLPNPRISILLRFANLVASVSRITFTDTSTSCRLNCEKSFAMLDISSVRVMNNSLGGMPKAIIARARYPPPYGKMRILPGRLQGPRRPTEPLYLQISPSGPGCFQSYPEPVSLPTWGWHQSQDSGLKIYEVHLLRVHEISFGPAAMHEHQPLEYGGRRKYVVSGPGPSPHPDGLTISMHYALITRGPFRPMFPLSKCIRSRYLGWR